ncbi:MAG: B12-binding domain-containing radical SAM protein [Flavobacteriales bacterium]|nr:B12-binding domain-containing radical SAM protein [Flavobacteriales bacterium]
MSSKGKILFSHSYFYPLDEKQWNTKTPYPPLGTIWAASVMRNEGHEVALFDTNLRWSPDDVKAALKQGCEYFVLYDDGFNYLSKMCLTNMRDAAMKMIDFAKQEGKTVIVSSSDSSDHYQKYLDGGADAVIIGEGEQALKEIIAACENGSGPNQEISGIVYSNNSETIKTKPRAVMTDLDSIPLPAWDLIDIESYRKIWRSGNHEFALNIATTRGCPFKCNWCAKPIYGNRYNSRSPENVIEELKLIQELFGDTKFWMCDDIFGLKPQWVQDFNHVLKENNLKINYKIQSRADLLVKDDTIEALAESGLYEVWIGAESGSQKILDAMDKGTTLAQIKSSTIKLQKLKVRVAYFIQFGYLGETEEDIELTLKMVENNRPDDIGVSVSYPLPGTKFFEMVKSDLDNKANWTDSDELAMMFSGTFNSEYYKTLHRYIHKMFRSAQGRAYLKKSFNPAKWNEINWRTMGLLPYNTLKAKKYNQQLQQLSNKS